MDLQCQTGDRSFVMECWNRLQSITMRQCLQIKRLLWVGPLERMKVPSLENVENKASGSLAQGQPSTTWSDELRRDWEGWTVSKELAKDIIV